MTKKDDFFDVYKEIFNEKNNHPIPSNKYRLDQRSKYNKKNITVIKKKKSKTKYIIGIGTVCLCMVIAFNNITYKNSNFIFIIYNSTF